MARRVTLSWCKTHGIKLIEPNENLTREYLQTAEETLIVLKGIEGKSQVWLATTKYYCEYFAFYALLMRAGVKCENHECTVLLAKLLAEQGIIPKSHAAALERDKQFRIDNQYYLKNRDVPVDHEALLNYVLTLKDIVRKLAPEGIERIREIAGAP